MLREFVSCAADMTACIARGPMKPSVQLSDQWTHVCKDESEFVLPGSARGVNPNFTDFSPVGGVLSHMIDKCRYGYAFGLGHSDLLRHDQLCGLGNTAATSCQSWADA